MTIAALALLAALTAEPPSAARVIVYRNADVPTIHTRVRFSTLIALPPDEAVLDYVLGDQESYHLEGNANFAYVKPLRDGAASNITLVCASGNAYSFIVDEVGHGVTADLKVLVQRAIDPSAATRPPVPVPTAAPTAAPAQATLRFTYHFEKNNPFKVSMIYEDGRFTYITCGAAEKPVLYEQTEDGPAVVNFTLQDGIYVVPKVLERGYLALGKRRLSFERAAR